MTEPTITINGHTLDEGQAMTLRVAIGHFLVSLADPVALGDDEHGRAMTVAYRQRLTEVAKLMRDKR